MARPELLEARPTWAGGKLNATTVLLEPLSDSECRELVSNLVGEDERGGRLEERIAEAAEGNPLFVEEMVSMLIDEGLLVPENGRWAVVGDVAAVPVPPTIHALLAARLDQLGDGERFALERAAVEGKIFHRGSIEQLTNQTRRSHVPTELGALVRKELIRPDRPVFAGEDAYRFRHLLIRDAAYESIPKSVRADLHERHAEWLEAKANERGAEYDEILGYHLEQAYRFHAELGDVDEEARAVGRRAAERLGAAGKRAFARLDAPAAMNLMSRATALLPNDDPLRVDLVPNVRAIQGAADLGWADAILQEAIASGDPRLRAHALVQRGFLRLFLHESDVTAEELIQVAEDAISVFEKREGPARARPGVAADQSIPLPGAKWTVERRGSGDRADVRAAERRPLRAAGDRRMARNRARPGTHDGSRGGGDLPAIAGSAGRRSGDGAHPHRGPGVHGGNPGTDRGGRAARRRSTPDRGADGARRPGSFRSCSPSSWRG